MQSVLPGAVRVTRVSTLRWCVTLQSRRIGIDSESEAVRGRTVRTTVISVRAVSDIPAIAIPWGEGITPRVTSWHRPVRRPTSH